MTSKPAAFRATFCDLKVIKTRGQVQLVFEVPLADFDAAYDVLGGLPNSAKERWFGIAPIMREAPAENVKSAEKKPWRELLPQTQAAIRCEEVMFSIYLQEEHPDNWHESAHDPAECVRLICGVESRSDLETNHKARVAWHQLDDGYLAWKTLERVA